MQSLLEEQIQSERELYLSERKADGVALRRLLRECLRQDDLVQRLQNYPAKQLAEFIAAVQSVCDYALLYIFGRTAYRLSL